MSWGLVLGLVLLGLLVLIAVGAPLITNADPTFESVSGLSATGEPLDAGSAGHPLGTDPKGRDLLARILYGGRLTLVTALAAVAIATAAGVLVGLAAASSRRFAGSVLMRFTDLGLAIPGLLLAAAIATILGRGVLSLVLGLAAVFWAPIARVTYGQAVVLREREYVEAARIQGAGSAAILWRHVFPHLLPVVGAYAALSVGWAVLFESALGFLGAGIAEPDASIGSLLGCCLVYYRSHPGLILFPAIFLFVLVAAANLVGESLRVPPEADR
jgi:peptide/nickel transport system permease protein